MQHASDQTLTSPLGAGVLAVRAHHGVVPAGCFGLSRAGERFQRHHEGQTAKIPKGGRLWWVCEGPVALRFAPQPQAPEAGVQVTIEIFMPGGKLDDKWARWLDDQPDTVDAALLALDFCRRAPLRSVPPCVGQEELNRRARMLNADLVRTADCAAPHSKGLIFTLMLMYRSQRLPSPASNRPSTARSQACQVRPARAPTQ